MRIQRSLFSMISGLTNERRPTATNNNESATTPLLSEAGTADSPERSSIRTAMNRNPLTIPPPTDPDYVDFVNGMVNVSRGDNTSIGGAGRSAVRDRRVASDDGASLLASYLAGDGDLGGGLGTTIPGLGRLLRVGNNGGNGGGGIDIHIHAIVTGPGMMAATAAAGLGDLGTATTLLSGNSTTTINAGNEAAMLVRPPVVNDDDDGLFSELYSEGLPHATEDGLELQREDNHFNNNDNDDDDDTDDGMPPLHSRHSSSSSSSSSDEDEEEEELDDLPDLLGDENSLVEGDASSMTNGGGSSHVRPPQRSPLGRFFRRIGRRGDPS
uniref:Uncharacterized protein n=1 Tax=Attheya septentrionalis TaxID=420275 RepID=A0A7S2UJK9_9STRA